MNKLFRRFNIRSEQEDYAVIHQVMESGIVFKGTNLWILIFAIFIACVGLNVNSTAVIIGAMLISPLMGPIIGMGYSLATYDFGLLKRAASNFGFAVVSGLITSTLYFLVTPISEAHSELLARTQPNIYDVLIALFGGLAGIIAMSSKVKGNIIPGGCHCNGADAAPLYGRLRPRHSQLELFPWSLLFIYHQHGFYRSRHADNRASPEVSGNQLC